MESSLIFELKLLSVDFGCMHGLTPTGYSQIHVGKSLRWIHNIENQNSFGELWINKGFESKKGLSLLTEHEYQLFISIEENH
jgi:hypothetical protein